MSGFENWPAPILRRWLLSTAAGPVIFLIGLAGRIALHDPTLLTLSTLLAFAEIMDKRDPKIAEKIRNDFSPIWESELGMPCAHARKDYRALMPTLEHLAELGDFRIEDHLLKDT